MLCLFMVIMANMVVWVVLTVVRADIVMVVVVMNMSHMDLHIDQVSSDKRLNKPTLQRQILAPVPFLTACHLLYTHVTSSSRNFLQTFLFAEGVCVLAFNRTQVRSLSCLVTQSITHCPLSNWPNRNKLNNVCKRFVKVFTWFPGVHPSFSTSLYKSLTITMCLPSLKHGIVTRVTGLARVK